MKRPLLKRWERIHLSTRNDLFADRLKLHLALVRFNRKIGRAVLPLITWIDARLNANGFSYLYYLLWFMKLSGMILVFYILNR